jgi:amino acid efflux transporter
VKDRLSTSQGVALAVGTILGTGIIGLPGVAARMAGPASLIAWAAVAVLSVPLAITMTTLGARVPVAGGIAAHVRLAFGQRPYAAVGLLTYVISPLSTPTMALFAGAAVAEVTGTGRTATLVVAGAVLAVALVANGLGLRASGRSQLVLVALVVILLVTAVSYSLPHAELENLTPFAPHGWSVLLPVAAMLVWCFAGWEVLAPLADKFVDPARDLRRVSTVTVAVIALLYFGVAAATVLVLGDTAAGHGSAPVAALLGVVFGAPAQVLAVLVMILLALGAANASFASSVSLATALSRDGVLPPWLAAGGSRRILTVLAVLVTTVFAVIAVADIDVYPLVMLGSAVLAAMYLASTAAAVRLFPAGSKERRIAWVALVEVALLLASCGWYAAAVLAAVIVAGFARRRGRLPTERVSAQA